MKVEILAIYGDPSPFVLFAGGVDSPEDLEGTAADQLQLIELARSPQVTPVNRGNRRHEHRMQRTVDYGSVAAAESAIWSHPAAVPTGSYIRITTEGASPFVRLLNNATVYAFAYRQIGTSIVWKYTIAHGTDADITAPTFASITGVILTGSTVEIVPSGTGSWLTLLDSVTTLWRTVWWANGVFTTGATTPVNTIGWRINAGFLQLADSVSGHFRSVWFNNGILESGPVDSSAADGNPASAARIYSVATGVFLQLADQAFPFQFRTLSLAQGIPTAGPLTS